MNSSSSSRAFTLVELMVAMAVTVLLIGLLASIANSTSRAWKQGSDRVETFAGARSAMALIGRELQGAIVDLDLGYAVQYKGQRENKDYVLKFLTRREPTADDPSGIQKIAYQLAWASRSLIPEIREDYDSRHPISVLVRTVSYSDHEMNDIFDITNGKNPYDWINNWPTADDLSDPDKTQVVAENVLGWEVSPVYLDKTKSPPAVMIDSSDSNAPITWVDRVNNNTPLYITSDLKYAKRFVGSGVTTDSSPRAIEIRLAAVPSSILPRLTQESSLANVRNETNLFKPEDLSDSPFDKLLKQNLRVFDATYYLSSKTP